MRDISGQFPSNPLQGSFDMTRLRRFNPDEELTRQEIKDLKDGVPNYGPNNGFVEVEGPDPLHEHMCGECTGSGIMIGHYPCRPCGGTGYIVPDSPPQWVKEFELVKTKDQPVSAWKRHFNTYETGDQDVVQFKHSIGWTKSAQYKQEMNEAKAERIAHNLLAQFLTDLFPNQRELSLLNNRIATLKAQLSKELALKKGVRNERDIKQLQESINTLTKWKNQKKN